VFFTVGFDQTVNSHFMTSILMSRVKRTIFFTVISIFAWILLAGCSGDAAAEALSKISSTDRIIAIDEVLNSPFKDLKHYDTTDLPGASAAVYGFMRSGSEAFDYEVRVYESHAEAVDLGTAFAEEGAGPDAALSEDDAVFKDGVTDRRLAYGADRGAAGPKYGTYVIYENLVILCQGANADQAFERCEFFVSALDGSDS
jgi:hypothetical protein